MKKCMSLLLTFVLLASMLSGCLSSSDPNLETLPTKTAPTTTAPTRTQPTTIPTQPSTVPTQPEDADIELESWINYRIRCADSEAERVPSPVVIKSAAELQAFASTDIGKELFDVPDASDLFAYFNDAYFEEHTLILVGMVVKYGPNSILDVESAVKTVYGYYRFTIDESKKVVFGPARNTCSIWFVEVKYDIPKDAAICIDFPRRNVELINYDSYR